MGQMALVKEQNSSSQDEHAPHSSSLKLDLSEINLSEAARFIRYHMCSQECVENIHWLVEREAPKSVKRDARFLVRRRRKRLKDAATTLQRHVKGFLLRKHSEFSKLKSSALRIEKEMRNWKQRKTASDARGRATQTSKDEKTSLREGCAIMIQQWWQQGNNASGSNEAGDHPSSENVSGEAEHTPLFQPVSEQHAASQSAASSKQTPEKMELESVHSPRSSDPSTAMEYSPMAQSSRRGFPSEQSERKGSEDSYRSSRSVGFRNINDVFASRAAAAKQALLSSTNETEQARERQKRVELMEKQRLESVRRKAKQEAGKKAREATIERQRALFQDLMKELKRWHQHRREKKHEKARRKRAEKLRASKQRKQETEQQEGPKDKAKLREEMQSLVRNARVALRNRLQQSAASQDNSQQTVSRGSRGSSAGEDSRSAKDHMRIAAARQANQQSSSLSKRSRKRRRAPKGSNENISVEQELGLSLQQQPDLQDFEDKQPRIAPATPIRNPSTDWAQVRSYNYGLTEPVDDESDDSESGFDITATVQVTECTQQEAEHDASDEHESMEHQRQMEGGNNHSTKQTGDVSSFNPIMTETPVELEHLNYKIDQATSVSYHKHSNPGVAIREELAKHHSKKDLHRKRRTRRGDSSSPSQSGVSPFVSYDGKPVSSVEELLQHYRR